MKFSRTANDDKSGYQVFRFAGKPVIAIPHCNRRIKLSALQCYRGATLRRSVFVWALRLLTQLGCDRFVSHYVDNPLEGLVNFDFSECVDMIQQSIGVVDGHAVIVWPPQQDRGRIYIHLLDSNGQPKVFAKLSLDPKNDQEMLRESQALAALATLGIKSFQAPSLVETGIWNDHQYCIFQSISSNARPIPALESSFPEECVREYAGEIDCLTVEARNELPWWKEFVKKTSRRSRFFQDICAIDDQPTRVCRAHGDLGTSNILRERENLVIFDWEEFCENAPVMTDRVMFFLILNQRMILSNPARGIEKIWHSFWVHQSTQQRHDFLMALAFLSTSNKPVAIIILKNWDTPNIPEPNWKA